MKVGDLVRVNPQSVSGYTKRTYPHVTEFGIIVVYDLYHPTVLYSGGYHIVPRSCLRVIS